MQNFSARLSKWEHLWQGKNLTYWAIGWTAIALFTFMLLGGGAAKADRPLWYRLFTGGLLQNVPLLVAGLLCLRNGLSRRMPSGSQVWLLMGIAMISYLIGNIFFAAWELAWGLNSTGSLGDPFFVIFYICVSWAMVTAIVTKRVRLNIYQWVTVAAITLYAATLVTWILKPAPTAVEAPAAVVSTAQSSTAANTGGDSAPSIATPAPAEEVKAPGWVMFFEELFEPYGQNLNSFYVWSDVFLIALAMIMILGFWNGRLSNAWQMNAQAIVCFYIADMWYAYAGNQIEDYQAGFMLEVFWTLGAIQFAMAANTEFEHMLARQRQEANPDGFDLQ